MEVLEQPPELLEQFASGELDAFETLFRQFQGEVFRWIVRMVRDPGVAEDLTIETFWRIHRAHARFDAKRNFGAWARRIATNVAIDYLKSGPGKATRAETVLHEHLPAANGEPGNAARYPRTNPPSLCGPSGKAASRGYAGAD